MKLATKDADLGGFFGDYCSEAQVTRRLNDVGCRNVIKVLDWGSRVSPLGTSIDLTKNSSNPTGPREKVLLSYCLRVRRIRRPIPSILVLQQARVHTQSLFQIHNLDGNFSCRLIFPEAFLWHIFYSMANALCYCRHGTNDVDAHAPVQGWDQIVHGDFKPENVFLAAPDPADSSLYPCLKLGDFGKTSTLLSLEFHLQRILPRYRSN